MNDFYTRIELADKLAKAIGKSGLNTGANQSYCITTADFGFSKKFGYNGTTPPIIAVTQPKEGASRWYGYKFPGVKDDEACSLIVVDFDILNLNFMREGTLKASSTYLKLPIAVSDYVTTPYPMFSLTTDEGSRIKECPAKVLKTKKEIDEWFDEILPAEIEFMRTQEKELSAALKKIKTEGKPYKDIIKQYGKTSTKGREARETYENMILAVMNKLTKREAIKKSSRMFEV